MKKLFAILLTVALFATNAVIVMANDYEESGGELELEAIVVARPFAASVTWFPEREFDNLIEELLYRRFFGDVSEFLLPYFTEINQTFTVGQFEIEIIGAIALEGRRRSQVWHTYEGAYRDFVIETVFVPIVESNVFVAIRDLNGELDLRGDAHLELAQVFDEFGWPHPDGGWPQALHIRQETDRAFFVINQHHDFEETPGQIDISFTTEYLLIDLNWSRDFAGINFADLLQHHEASFIAEIYTYDEDFFTVHHRGWASPLGIELFGDDFDPMAPGFGVLAEGELSIQLAEGFYLSNIAITDDVILRVQLTSPPHVEVRTGMGWTTVQLINRMLEEERNALWEESNRRWIEWFEAGYDWEAYDDSWLWDELNAIDGRDLQELFQIRIHQFAPDAPEVAETGYLIDDLDLLNQLDFIVNKSYYGTHLPLPFSFSGTVLVHSFPTVVFPGTHTVFVHDRYLYLSSVAVSLTEISFDVKHTEFLVDLDREEFISAHDLFEIDIIMVDGTVLRELWFRGSTWWHPADDGISNFSFNYFIDVREVAGLRINGTEIRME